VYDVAQVLGFEVGRFTDESLPAKETVESFIRYAEDYIDRFTNSAWREKKRWEDPDVGPDGYEYHRIQSRSWFGYSWMGNEVYLRKRRIRHLDRDLGDSLQIWNGRDWEEWLGVRTEGYNGDFWVDYDNGVVFLKRIFWYGNWYGHTFRIRYRYGGLYVPQDIRQACALLAASRLVENGDYAVLLPEGANNIVVASQKAAWWREEAHRILEMHRELIVID